MLTDKIEVKDIELVSVKMEACTALLDLALKEASDNDSTLVPVIHGVLDYMKLISEDLDTAICSAS